MAQKVSGIAGMSWICIIVDKRTQNEDAHIDRANSDMYVKGFVLTFLVCLFFTYSSNAYLKHKFHAPKHDVSGVDDTDGIARMQKVFAAFPAMWRCVSLQILEPACQKLGKEERIFLAVRQPPHCPHVIACGAGKTFGRCEK